MTKRPDHLGLVNSSFEQARNQGSEGNAADVTACQEAAEGMDVGDFAENLTSEARPRSTAPARPR